MLGLSEETQKKIGYGLLAGGVVLGGIALYKKMNKPAKKAALGRVSGRKRNSGKKKGGNKKKHHK